ncbi:hypothetical protein HHI36_000398 [Cryptolaemus montrouzieri]|uniref:Uncharacterized protein n=1 Tax=Cryptolaemus montrouzieri TaxID=559131 RepID=A0ABD2P599_9CUCU
MQNLRRSHNIMIRGNPENTPKEDSTLVSDILKSVAPTVEDQCLNVVGSVRSTMCTEEATPNLKDKSGNLCRSPVQVANVLADFFAASFTSEPDRLPNSSTPRNLNELCDIEFTASLVRDHLTTLDTTSTPSPDGITA